MGHNAVDVGIPWRELLPGVRVSGHRTDEDIVRLWKIHVQIDEAVREAYALDEERESVIREYEVKVASESLSSWPDVEVKQGNVQQERHLILP